VRGGVYLTRFASEVHLVHRRDSLRASKIMAQRVLSHEKIKPVWDTAVTEILDVQAGQSDRRAPEEPQDRRGIVLPCAGVFVAIGHVPNTQLFKGVILDMDENGYIIPTHGTATNIPGVFVAGDCADHVYRQAITAAGSGCAAAIDAV
jgi:thioredoxin reductase (NADPH)